MPNPVSRTSPVEIVEQDIGRLDVLVNETVPVNVAQSRRNSDGKGQEASHLHRRAKLPVERFTARIVEHQHDPVGLTQEVQRARRPCFIELVSEVVFMCEAIDGRA